MQAFATLTPDTHAKYLLASGSTGHPKVVINTHRMLCANQQMLAPALLFLDAEKPVLPDAPSDCASAGEITDKGYINQRLVLARRAADVEALYATPLNPRVICA